MSALGLILETAHSSFYERLPGCNDSRGDEVNDDVLRVFFVSHFSVSTLLLLLLNDGVRIRVRQTSTSLVYNTPLTHRRRVYVQMQYVTKIVSGKTDPIIKLFSMEKQQ